MNTSFFEYRYRSIGKIFFLSFSSKETTFKPTTIPSIEQQRERERQRLREDEERRKKFLIRKDHQQTPQMLPPTKFEPLSVDINNDESRITKTKTPTKNNGATAGTGTFSPHFPFNDTTTPKASNKPPSITPLSRTTNHDENEPNNNETKSVVAAAALVPSTLVSKKFVIKKRSTVLVSLIINILSIFFFYIFFSILLHLLLLINMNSVKKWVMEILRLYIVRNYVEVNVNMLLK
jgi:hypothetical protein